MTWFFAFFLISGFCSLVYEVVWLRLAMAKFGVTTPLVSIVLSVFMAGLALGSWLVGRLAARLEARAAAASLRAYALAEVVIAISGLVVPYELEAGRRLLEQLGTAVSWGSSTYYLASALWIALTLLPFCTCMGATFPLAMSAIRKTFAGESGRSFSYLYFANVVGATAGTVVSAFFLVELLGFRGTLRVTAGLNGILALLALAVSFILIPSRAPGRPAASAGEATPARPRTSRHSVLAFLFLTGLASMAMEVVWIRQFTPYLGTLVYAFAAILALYLTATFLGSSAYRVWSRLRKASPDARPPGLAWTAVGLLSLIPLVTADPRLSPVGEPPIQAFQAGGALRLALGIMPFCAVVGFLTPMLVDRWSRGDPKQAGSAYAVNVLGSILGPLVAGFGLLPLMAERWALLVLASPFFAIAVLAALRGVWATGDRGVRGAPGLPRLAIAAVAASLVVAPILLAVTRDYETIFPQRVVLRDNTATVIAAGDASHRRLLVNGIGMTVLTPITKMMAHLPMAALGRAPENSLVVCFGMGTSFRSLLSWGAQTTAVELVPSVPLLFSYYHPDALELMKSPLARIVIDDGRRFLERTAETYDVVTIDPPPPVETAGSSLLYSREFYAVVKRRLRPGGILQQWIPGTEALVVASATRALAEAFPHVRAFPYPEGWGIHFLASMRPIPLASAAELARRMPERAAQDLIEWGPAASPEEQLRTIVEGEVSLASVVGVAPRTPALRDDRPVNEYFFLRRALLLGSPT